MGTIINLINEKNMKKNLVGLWCNLFRAIEVAKTGGYSVSVYFNHDYKNGFDDYNAIKSFCKGWFNDFAEDGDIKVEIIKPVSYEQKGTYETIKDISYRIKKSLQFPKPELKYKKDSEQLLKTAIEKLDLSYSQVEKLKQVSATIAQMDFSKDIQAYHLCEAIQYSYIRNDCMNGYNAESKSKMFGDKIQIKLGDIDNDSIKAAINYLNKLLMS